MKKIIILFVLHIACRFPAQDTNAESDHDLFISGGVHAGIIALSGLRNVPYNIQADKLLRNRYVIGAAYAFDYFNSVPIFFTMRRYYNTGTSERKNWRIRCYRYLRAPGKCFAMYIGGSAGYSAWKVKGRQAPGIPSLQFLYGIKVKLSDAFFTQAEAGFGSPYACQATVGIKF